MSGRASAREIPTVQPPAIEVAGLVKRYEGVQAVGGISFSVSRGEVFALLGPNGAGKTTTLEVLEGHKKRSGGTVSVLGVDPWRSHRAVRERIGIVLQSAGIDGELKVNEVLSLYAGYYPRPLPVNELISLVGLRGKRRSRIRTLSGGQRRRLDLALALIGDPELIFLDEPTIGLDPGARRGAWDLIRSLRSMGRTIVLTSHYMDEVERLADRMIVLSAGQIVGSGSPASLSAALGETRIRFRLPPGYEAQRLPGELRGQMQSLDGEIALSSAEPTRTLLRLCSWAVESAVELRDLHVSAPSLEEAYLGLTSEQGDAAP